MNWIQATADIISDAGAAHGGEDDFIGHIGGDDFVVITAPDNYSNICAAIVENFDKALPDYYETKDRKRGHISGEDRQGNKAAFPLATISIAVVTNQNRKLLNHIQFGEAAAEMKEQAKSKSGSLFLVDQRNDKMGRIAIIMKAGFIWAIISFLIGCTQFQEMVNPQTASQNQKIEQLTTELQNSLLKNHALKQENKKLRADNFRLVKANAKLKTANRQLMNTNSGLKTDNRQLMDTNNRLKTNNQDLAMKIDILKILDHRVEEKRKTFTSD
ncbi:MAG: hypothetical protein GY850_03670 [bacterium]|nr:hypothetical protein [bacterium]